MVIKNKAVVFLTIELNNVIFQDVYDMVIYHPVKQTPTEKNLCKTAGCSHGCTRQTLFAAKCKCPEGLTLDPDNATCQG